MLTEQQKKYLITIFLLGQEGEPVRTTDIALRLHVAKASAVKMEKRLIEEGLISKEPYRRMTLTPKGITEAGGLFASCLILQEHLTEKIGIAPDKAREASLVISAGLDAQTLDRIVEHISSQKD